MVLTTPAFLTNTIVILPVLLATAIAVAVYRCTFHPLCSVPGPKLAAISGLFIFYYDVIQDGKLPLELERLHDRYGEPSSSQFLELRGKTYLT